VSHRRGGASSTTLRRIPVAAAAVVWLAAAVASPAHAIVPDRNQETPPARDIQGDGDTPRPPASRIAGQSLSVYLLTAEPGDRIYEVFGHNAILVRDSETGYEQGFNYGIFSFDSPGYLGRFLKGRMMYRVGTVSAATLLAGYGAQNRRIWAQELDLEPARKAQLLQLLQTAVQPENQYYRYEYYLNNCSTKLRDILDTVLDGQLREATDGPPTGATWRDHTRRLTAGHPLGYLGIDLVLGPKGDESTNRWQEMWVPMKLRDTVGALFITRSDGNRVRLVRTEGLWLDSTRESETTFAPSHDLLFLLAGVAVAMLYALVGSRTAAGSVAGRIALGLFGSLWGLFCLIAGAVMIGAHWTDHEFMYWNQNILLFSPLGVGVAWGLVRVAREGGTSIWGRRFALGALGLAGVALVLNLIPVLASGNREMIAFALPVHASVCRLMLRINRMDTRLAHGRRPAPADIAAP